MFGLELKLELKKCCLCQKWIDLLCDLICKVIDNKRYYFHKDCFYSRINQEFLREKDYA